MEYNNYPTNMDDPLGPRQVQYNAATDELGFTGFIPTQCTKRNSFMIDKVEAPIIALVGDVNDPPMAAMIAYMQKLVEIQKFAIS